MSENTHTPDPTKRAEILDGRVEGIDYTREGILSLREEVIALRNEAMKQWPAAIPETVMLSHVIAIMAWAAGQAPENPS